MHKETGKELMSLPKNILSLVWKTWTDQSCEGPGEMPVAPGWPPTQQAAVRHFLSAGHLSARAAGSLKAGSDLVDSFAGCVTVVSIQCGQVQFFHSLVNHVY